MQLNLRTPDGMPNYLKDMFARDVIKLIIERTKSGKDSSGSSFRPYSDAYKSSEVFKDRGKDPNNVNLTLFGEMLESMSHKKTATGVVIFFREQEEALKAHGHNNGSMTLPRRHFFDIDDKEYNRLFDEYERITKRVSTDELSSIIESATRVSKDRGYRQEQGDGFGVDLEIVEGEGWRGIN
jgi:hypothetical protein